jgi:hypothetical protein
MGNMARYSLNELPSAFEVIEPFRKPRRTLKFIPVSIEDPFVTSRKESSEGKTRIKMIKAMRMRINLMRMRKKA